MAAAKEAVKKVPQKKLLIIGTASNRNEAPYDDPTYEVWATGGCINLPDVRRVDVAFELHPERYWKDPKVLGILSTWKGHIYMQEHYEEIPTSVKYPYELVRQRFYIPSMGENLYVTNTVSFMFALAALQGFKEIETFGVWMEHTTEYGNQKPNCEYYLGYLHALGVKLTINGGELLKCAFEYAYKEPPAFVELIEHNRTLTNGKAHLEKELLDKQREVWQQEGALKYNADLRKKYGGY